LSDRILLRHFPEKGFTGVVEVTAKALPIQQ
jgi:hypothetical protein